MSRVSTVYLLTCAAIGVAGGALLWGAGWIAGAVFAVAPFVSVAGAGLWLLPAAVGMRLLERPGTALLIGLLSGLVAFPFLGASLWWAFFIELPFLIVLYRFYTTWQYFAGAVAVGLVYPILSWASFDLGSVPVGLQVTFFALTMASCLVGAGLGVLIGDRLRKAGVAKLARRRGLATRGMGRGAGPAGQH
ncbi:MAG: hypothetical protein CMH34_06335 [Microbacterium sp.]|nr:hypothetical protein [Microbacterium sp.]